MARYCSPQLSIRTRLSPPYRATIRLKVFQGRNSISWAKSVLPVFIGDSRDHPGSLLRLQIVDTAFRSETRDIPRAQSRSPSVNRTAVTPDNVQNDSPDFRGEAGRRLSRAGGPPVGVETGARPRRQLKQHFLTAGSAKALPVEPVVDGGRSCFLHRRTRISRVYRVWPKSPTKRRVS